MSKKILSILLTLTILIGILSVIPITANAAEADLAEVAAEVDTADTSAAYSSDWRLWSQGASDYAIMRSYGCWVVAMSKMFRQSEIATDINPDDYYWWERNNGYLPDNDYNLNQVDGANAPVAFAASRGKTLNLDTVNNSPSTDDLWSYINRGYYTIIKVNASYDHYVYIENSSSKAQGDIRILESFNNQNEVGSYSLAERYGGAVTAYVYRYITDYEYNLHDDGTAEIIRYRGSGGDIIIPNYLGGFRVTSTGCFDNAGYQYGAFQDCTELTSIVIPDSVTRIGVTAFRGCTGLTRIEIPNSVTSIDIAAFENCTSLTNIVIPNSVASIGDYAFWKCTSLTSVTIPNSVTSIGWSAFEKCTSLTNIVIPDSVTSIGGSAFYNCTSLTSVNIPDSVTSIGGSAFYNTAWYNNQPEGLVYAGKVAYKMKRPANCPSHVDIKNGTVGIAGGAFLGCTGLSSIDIPDSVTTIGSNAFLGCTGLSSIDIPDSVTSIGWSAFEKCTSLTSITIPNSVTTIEGYAFKECTSLTSVTIPNSVTYIGDIAFSYCTSLTRVTIPNSVTYIGDRAFGYGDDYIHDKVIGFTIFGVEGSAAQTYANENGFAFVKITEKTDGDTGIIIYAPEDVSVKAQVIDLAEDAVKAILMNHGFVALVAVYDITMWLYEESVQPESPVPVSIPCTNEKTKVYRQEEDGSLTDMNAFYEDGYMVFYTDHFSTYILAVPGEETEPYILGDADGDGDVSSIDATYILRYTALMNVDIDEAILMNGDVDGNEELEVVDATCIQRYLAEFPTPYPIGEPI